MDVPSRAAGLAGLLTLWLAGCARAGFGDVADGSRPVDGQRSCGEWGAPAALTTVNGVDRDWGPSISSDGLTLYFSSSRSGGGEDTDDLWIAHRGSPDLEFQAPVPAGAGINTGEYESSPAISADDLTLYFDREPSQEGLRLHVAVRGAPTGEFSAAQPLGIAGQTPSGVSPSADGLSLYYGTNNETEAELAVATRTSPGGAFVFARQLDELNGPALDGWPSISADGLELYFESDRSGEPRLYVARRASVSAPFGAPARVLGAGFVEESDPAISADGRTLYFAAQQGKASYDLFVVKRSCSP